MAIARYMKSIVQNKEKKMKSNRQPKILRLRSIIYLHDPLATVDARRVEV